ncbi:SDR family NAD(P)-dependent oxidoreductase [Pseudoalteromonas sp. SMS1]|uniref:SDR family NAD(P)-dependent oxidoreductase n=1 Tax=Pseudoalteromonas sp. SMS1 TaxID=2908894 RepID=UPI001F2A91E5|nr:SDR family NAD(P)-dependent oxidoreductase [Pseudoalteromonas sp. SMS1]MCF2856087.1 SDR family NAD(P)-dependent oxidoreductase [Pseudoalteromonas sp. SMS1]
MNQETAVVIGASGAIGKALVNEKLKHRAHVIAVSRSPISIKHPYMTMYETDYSQKSILSVADKITRVNPKIQSITVCNGALHTQDNMPEKRIESFDSDYFNTLLHVNTAVPFNWLQAFMPHLLSTELPCVFTALSARIGSINDNRLGGWYSYRASKAALNMLFKTAAIELKRRKCNAKLMLFHPGTTDSELSKPFQNNVPPDKLFSPAFVAELLNKFEHSREFDGEVDFIDWQGETINW